MRYGDFINIFNKNYNLDYFYALFLKKKKKVKKILREEVDNEFPKFLLNNKIEKEEEIKVFFKLYNNKFNLDIIYLFYRNNLINLKSLENIRNMDDLRYVVLSKYKNYLKVEINKIDEIDLNNIFLFIIRYPKFYEDMVNDKYLGSINLNGLGIEKDLNFLKILGIEKINRNFGCSNNKNLKSLKGCPNYVGNDFNCCDCGLEELGIEEWVEINGDFNCKENKNLKSLKGCPSFIGRDFLCFDCGLEKLEIDENVKIEGTFNCNRNKNLKNLKGCPTWVGGSFYCIDCGLEELGMEKEVKIEHDFVCINNKNLKSLKGCPTWVGGNFYCDRCGLEELGIQGDVKVDKDFDCSDNKNLRSLKGSPSWVGGNFYCNGCGLDKIDLDKNIAIGENLICLRGNNVTKEQVEEYIRKNNINFKGEIK